MNTLESLNRKIDHAKALDFGDIISDAIELFKKVWLKGFLVLLIMFGFAFCIGFLFSLIGLQPQNNPFIDGFNFETYSSFYFSNVIYSIPQNILISTISLALVSAFYKICKQVYSGEQGHDDYFYFFKKEHFSKLLMLGIIQTAITSLAQLMYGIPYIYVFVPLSYFAIVFSNNPHLTEMEVVKASFKIGNKKWLITFGTMFVTLLLCMLGLIGCIIGILFTMSIVYLPVFLIYKDVVGFDHVTEIDQIGIKDDSNY